MQTGTILYRMLSKLPTAGSDCVSAYQNFNPLEYIDFLDDKVKAWAQTPTLEAGLEIVNAIRGYYELEERAFNLKEVRPAFAMDAAMRYSTLKHYEEDYRAMFQDETRKDVSRMIELTDKFINGYLRNRAKEVANRYYKPMEAGQESSSLPV
jgi:hypothetical protein